jgi:predicted ABC-type ATPase
VDLALARVADRVRRGGHEVPAGVVARRFRAGLRNLFGPYLAKVDTWQVLDNSGSQGPRPIAKRRWGVEDLPRIVDAMQRAVRKAIEQHRKDGDPIAIWRDGAVVWIPPEDIPPLES